MEDLGHFFSAFGVERIVLSGVSHVLMVFPFPILKIQPLNVV